MCGELGTLSESETSFLAKFWLRLTVSICLHPSPRIYFLPLSVCL